MQPEQKHNAFVNQITLWCNKNVNHLFRLMHHFSATTSRHLYNLLNFKDLSPKNSSADIAIDIKIKIYLNFRT